MPKSSVPATPPLLDFLTTSKQAFLDSLHQSGADLSEWTITVGNQAGDLDSLVSSIAFAYFLHIITPPKSLSVPLIMTARSDLYLRPENQFALEQANVPAEALLCIDDIPDPAALAARGANFALDDHNVLLPVFRSESKTPSTSGKPSWDTSVTAIIDHHADEGKHTSAEPRLIEPVGSCTSLVLSYFSPLLPPEYAVSVPTPLADLLLSTIAIDTSLKPSTNGGKATPKDLAAVQFLLPLSSFRSGSAAPSAVMGPSMTALIARHQVLMKKKIDISSMSGRDLLRRDYKEYQESGWKYGLSTVPLGLKAWLEKDKALGRQGWQGIEQDLLGWMKERNLSFAGILTSFSEINEENPEGKAVHAREIVLYVGGEGAKVERLREVLFTGLQEDQVLKVEKWKGGAVDGLKDERGWRVWSQGNARATRKQVAPVIKGLLARL
ncbi:BQ5605_C019g08894 [Microbotryum silenes-dioicae]|uniref:BQ5605_C019g08894 protein n=1 Tax=Microbotryum silenes-dioicae TaxID=796604 RepID=A0A2X0M0P7_9BASI|nr:BQ5605_C019g08894 [Microbotryum silenes-dioicae]